MGSSGYIDLGVWNGGFSSLVVSQRIKEGIMSFKIWMNDGIIRIQLEINHRGLFHEFTLEIGRLGVRFSKLLNLPF